jgi:nifR3 family TIM-barrel protein
MHNGFWGELPKPFFALAPMLDVTDAAFRRIVVRYGKPDVLWSEFVSADGLCSRGREALLPMLAFTDAERPIVAQIFGANPATIRSAASLVASLWFDGVDINMGCPDRKVLKQNAGAALIGTPALAAEIIRAAQEGARSAGRRIPVSVKTRTGDTEDTLDAWLPRLLEAEPAAVTVHARTRKELSKVPARWERVAQAVRIRDSVGAKTLIIGNGDVLTRTEGERRAEETGCDGVMVGRAVLGNPWFFAQPEHVPTREEKLRVLAEHAVLFEQLRGARQFDVFKKHIAAYVRGFPGAAELRLRLMETGNAAALADACCAATGR